MLKKFHFYRFEFKYLIDERYKDFIRKDLLPFMDWDSYAKLNKNNKYLVNSLYFDSFNLKSYQDKIGGLDQRFKLRLRNYSFNKSDEIFFEIKKKKSAVIIKDRGVFKASFYKYFINSNNIKLLKSKNIKKKDILNNFLYLKIKHQMRPMVRVVYIREPFEAINYNQLRITFDSEIQASKIADLYTKSSFKDVLKDSFILEVKFRGLLPYWFHDIVQKYQLERVAYSKYCRSVESVL